jgi:hypothetical protein
MLSQTAWATPKKIMVIRHGEKPVTGNHLSAQGKARARALVKYFETSPDVTIPDVIFAMTPGSEDESMRPIETVTPLAESLGLKIKSEYTRDEIKPLVKKIMKSRKYDGKTVLICWEHRRISKLVHRLGVDPKPADWPDDVFDQVWEIDFAGDSKHSKIKSFQEITQKISLPGLSSRHQCIAQELLKK